MIFSDIYHLFWYYDIFCEISLCLWLNISQIIWLHITLPVTNVCVFYNGGLIPATLSLVLMSFSDD